jgi:hypothetical protein
MSHALTHEWIRLACHDSAQTVEFIKGYTGRCDRLSFTIAPHAPYTVDEAAFLRVKQLSEELNVRVHTHLHETADECTDSAAGTRTLRSPRRVDGHMLPTRYPFCLCVFVGLLWACALYRCEVHVVPSQRQALPAVREPRPHGLDEQPHDRCPHDAAQQPGNLALGSH